MYIESIIFIIFSVMLLGSALAMILSRNTVYSALLLVVCFVASAVLWLLLNAEFLALILIFVYVGAVMTLFLFVVMLLNLEVVKREKGAFVRYLPIGGLLMVGMVGLMEYVVLPQHFFKLQPLQHAAHYSNIKDLGSVLYTVYAYPVQATAVLLLVAIIAVVSLATRHKSNRKSQQIQEQLAVTKEQRLRIVKMPTAGDTSPKAGSNE